MSFTKKNLKRHLFATFPVFICIVIDHNYIVCIIFSKTVYAYYAFMYCLLVLLFIWKHAAFHTGIGSKSLKCPAIRTYLIIYLII